MWSGASVFRWDNCVCSCSLCSPSPGCTASVSLLDFQPELDRVIVALASALSHACGQSAGASRKVKTPQGDRVYLYMRTASLSPQRGGDSFDVCACTHACTNTFMHVHTTYNHTRAHSHTQNTTLMHTHTCTYTTHIHTWVSHSWVCILFRNPGCTACTHRLTPIFSSLSSLSCVSEIISPVPLMIWPLTQSSEGKHNSWILPWEQHVKGKKDSEGLCSGVITWYIPSAIGQNPLQLSLFPKCLWGHRKGRPWHISGLICYWASTWGPQEH